MTLSLWGLRFGQLRVDRESSLVAAVCSIGVRLLQRCYPVFIALPILMGISYLEWQSARPPYVGPLPITRWLELTFVGASAPMVAFILALRISTRWPLFDSSLWKSIGVHSVAMVVAVIVDAITRWFISPRSPIPVVPLGVPMLIGDMAGLYAMILLAIEGLRAFRNARRDAYAQAWARNALAEAGRKRAEAELRALKAELNPHFLGNALQSVKALMRTDIEAATDVLVPLGDVLRDALSRAMLEETTLREELASLEQFVAIERARLRGQFDIQFDIDPDAMRVLVPDLILQPLVENAVKHGLVPFGGGAVRVSATRSPHAPNKLRLTVEDDGVALGAVGTTRASHRGGVGLANIRARLAELYGNGATLELKRGGLGTCAIVDIPWHDADVEPGAFESDADEGPEQDAREVAVVRPFFADSWLGRTRRVTAVSAAIYLSFIFAQQSIQGGMAMLFGLGIEGNLGYLIADGALAAAFLLSFLFVAARVARRWQLVIVPDRLWRSVWRPVAMGVLVGLIAALCFLASRVGLFLAFHFDRVVAAYHLKVHNVSLFVTSVVAFLIAWSISQGYYAMRRGQRAKARRCRLDEQLDAARRRRAEAELRALKAELNPHFIGNAFTAVSVLMRNDPPAASRLIDQLSDLLRVAVDRAGTQEVTLREELDSLEPFLDVERLRLGRELAVSLNVDEEALGTHVPHMILQPLVENAVKHGFDGRFRGRIEVGAHRKSRFLELTIRDDGLGLDVARRDVTVDVSRRGGVGLSNARARLAKLYGPSATLELADGPEGGAIARVLIPWRDAVSS